MTLDNWIALVKDLAPYVTMITTIVALFVAFRHQQRLKAFELFYTRRMSIINDVEDARKSIQELIDESQMERYKGRAMHDALVLQRKILGGRFGREVNELSTDFIDVVAENVVGVGNDLSWLERQSNILTLIEGNAHLRLSREIDALWLPFGKRWFINRQADKETRRTAKRVR